MKLYRWGAICHSGYHRPYRPPAPNLLLSFCRYAEIGDMMEKQRLHSRIRKPSPYSLRLLQAPKPHAIRTWSENSGYRALHGDFIEPFGQTGRILINFPIRPFQTSVISVPSFLKSPFPSWSIRHCSLQSSGD